MIETGQPFDLTDLGDGWWQMDSGSHARQFHAETREAALRYAVHSQAWDDSMREVVEVYGHRRTMVVLDCGHKRRALARLGERQHCAYCHSVRLRALEAVYGLGDLEREASA